MKIIHKSTEQIPKDDNVWQMKTFCGIFKSDYMCSFRWKKVTCNKCLKKHNIKPMNKIKKKKLMKRIKDLKERIAMNTWDIEEGEPSDFKKYSRSDNVCCRKWLKEAEKELRDALVGIPASEGEDGN